MATTLLSIVQGILSDADGDNVNSISDTVESDQCAQVVVDCFEQIVDGYDLAHVHTLKQLAATSSSTPHVLTRPEGFYEIEWIKYDVRETIGGNSEYQDVTYLEPRDFLARVLRRDTDDTNVTAYQLTDSSVPLPIRTDKAPDYWTVLEGYDRIVFDSYDSDVDTNLQTSKNIAMGAQKPTLSKADASVPELPENLMHLLKKEARALYFDLYKDGVTPEIDRTRRRAENRVQRQRHIAKPQADRTGPDYGRK